MARFTPHTEADVGEMLATIGVETLDDLFADVAPRIEGDLDLPPALSEYEALRDVDRLARENDTGLPIFLGAGAYDRIVPSAVGAIISRGEFLTSYTPYQPEISQGTLQSIFEFQSIISELTGLEVSNASVYDGANAVAEAALMTARLTKRDPKVAVSAGLNPRYREVVETYRVEVVELPFDGRDHGLLGRARTTSPASSCRAPTSSASSRTSRRPPRRRTGSSALCVAVCDPISLAVLEAPGNLGADVAVGEAQPLGMPLLFGGPYAGYMATREEVRAPAPGAHLRRDRGPGRQARLRPHPARPRAGHPPRQGQLQHLHQPGAHGPRRDRLHGAHGPRRAARGRRALRLQGALSGRQASGFGRRAPVSGRAVSCGSSWWRCPTCGGRTRPC